MRCTWTLQSVAYGGMEVFVSNLARTLPAGNDVQVVVPPGAEFDAFAEQLRSAGARVDRILTDGRNGRASQLRGLISFYRTIRHHRPDVVHIHTGGATGGLAVAALARLIPSPVVLSEYDVPYTTPTRRHRITRRALDRLCQVVLAVSERNVALRTVAFGTTPPKLRVLEIGIPLLHSEELRAPRRATADEPPRFITVCRLAEGKGIDVLLRAFALVLAARPTATLELIGDGPLRGSLDALARDLGIAHAVQFSGHQSNPWAYRDGSEVFALAVPAGSMSTALLEAMSLGMCPVITFAQDGEAVIPDVNGLAAPPNDAPALAASLLAVADDPGLRNTLGLSAQQSVMHRFDIERAADRLFDIYASAQAGNGWMRIFRRAKSGASA